MSKHEGNLKDNKEFEIEVWKSLSHLEDKIIETKMQFNLMMATLNKK